YYNDAEQTRAAFDAEGYFVTGDLGLIDDDGRVRFRGRLKEMIKTGGINVAPLEVEAVLLGHSAVKQAYVVGVPDRARGEVVVAPSSSTTARRLRRRRWRPSAVSGSPATRCRRGSCSGRRTSSRARRRARCRSRGSGTSSPSQ